MNANYKNLEYIPFPVDATNLEFNESNKMNKLSKNVKCVVTNMRNRNKNNPFVVLRTLYSGFHHLRERQAYGVIYDTILKGDALLIAERLHQRVFLDLIKWPLIIGIAHPIKFVYSCFRCICDEYLYPVNPQKSGFFCFFLIISYFFAFVFFCFSVFFFVCKMRICAMLNVRLKALKKYKLEFKKKWCKKAKATKNDTEKLKKNKKLKL